MSIKVIIAGFKGRMGQAAYKMVSEDPELELAGLIDPFTDETEVAGSLSLTTKEDVVGLEAMFGSTYHAQGCLREYSLCN